MLYCRWHPHQLYEVVADIASYPRFIPFCTGSRILSKSRQRESATSPLTMDAELTIGFLSMKESYVSKVTCKPYISVEVRMIVRIAVPCLTKCFLQAVASSTTPLFKTLSTTWRFQPASPNSPHSSAGHLSSYPSSTSFQPNRGPTLVTLDLAFAFANPVHATVSATFFGQVSRLMVKAFEERCLEVYGPGSS